jgi:hypothetical protein
MVTRTGTAQPLGEEAVQIPSSFEPRSRSSPATTSFGACVLNPPLLLAMGYPPRLGLRLEALPYMPGYSGKPLSEKLGLKPSLKLWAIGAPPDYESWLGELPEGVSVVSGPEEPLRAAHLFTTERATLEAELARLRTRLDPAGMVWVSWPKKASKVPTDITEDVVREVALPMGFVDVKVCAVSDVWSGLKLVIRPEERTCTRSVLNSGPGPPAISSWPWRSGAIRR